MLVSSTRERVLAWGMMFCLITAACLICFLVLRNPLARKVTVATLVCALVIPVIIIPSIRREYIHVSETQMTIDTGSWISSSTKVINFENLHRISEIQDGILPGNLIGDPGVIWHISWEDGTQENLKLNDFFNAHRMVVAYYIRDHGHSMSRLEDPDFSF